jgi:glucosylceramidase
MNLARKFNQLNKLCLKIYSDPKKASVIDGLGSHWYSKSAYDVLQETHNLATDKFILATEVKRRHFFNDKYFNPIIQACTGYEPWGHKPLLGEWSRGMAYGHDILNNLKNWVIGWTDWNMCKILWQKKRINIIYIF